ncbi:hypothetical protein SAMN06265355_106197 [Actinomadura mexicana]|uniref:Uncharacterized protein n=1 Tax=Actinomadura mexicana TaxID=134959 RepID=A0A238YRU5_9ACTN|nr:hypothetical protein SAMN06265355_106197 [Actinomadura mexicana]
MPDTKEHPAEHGDRSSISPLTRLATGVAHVTLRFVFDLGGMSYPGRRLRMAGELAR